MHRLVQHHRACRRRQQNDAGLLEHRQHGLGVRRAPIEEECDHVWICHQLLRVLGGERRLVLVVQRHQFDLLAGNAALRIDVVQIQHRADVDFLHRRSDGTGDAGGLTDANLRCGGAPHQETQRNRRRRPHRSC